MFELLLNFHDNLTPSTDKDIFIFGAAGQEVSVQNGAGFSETVTIDADGFALVNIPDNQAMSGTGINNLGFQIVSDKPIQAYFSNRARFTTDLTIIFEKASLGTEYLLASVGGDVPGRGFGEQGQFSVQATEDNTTVDVTFPDGQSFSVDINAGETFKFATNTNNSSLGISIPSDFDLTGTLVKTSAPAAVFSGHECTQIGAPACDHIVEQMPPISALSSSYVVGEAKNIGLGDNFVRVIAAENNTEVVVDGTTVATLSAQESYDFTLFDTAAIIETSKPTLVAQFLQGQNLVQEGDPAMMFVPGRNSWLSEYRLANPAGSAAFDQNLVNIIIPTSALDSLTLNGAAVDTGRFTSIDGSGLSVANLAVNVGLFTLKASENFQVSLFGFEDFDSYLTFGAAAFAAGLSPVPPVAEDDAFITDEDTAFTTGNVLDNDTDANGDVISVSGIDTSGTVGSVTDNGDGTFDYDPNSQYESLAAGDSAIDTFAYTVTDGDDGSDTALVEITVEGVNDAPVVAIPIADQTATQAIDFSLALPSGTFTDVDQGDSLTITTDDLPDWLSYDEASQTFSGTPDAEDVGTVDITVTATDTAGESVSDTFSLQVSSVEVPNQAPTASADTVTTDEDTAITIAAATLLANDSDPDGDTLTVIAVDGSSTAGTVSLSGSSIIYTPSAGFSGQDSFTYEISDGELTDSAAVLINVNPIDLPTEPLLSVTTLVDADGDGIFSAQEAEANSGQVTFQVEVVNTGDVGITISEIADSTLDEAVLIDQIVGQTLAAGESIVATYQVMLSREDAVTLGTPDADTLSAEQFLLMNEVSVSGTTDDGLTATASSAAVALIDANSLIAGDLGGDTIFGGAGDDVLRGDLNLRDAQVGIGNDDVIFGGAGSDRIGGKGGNDILFGGDDDDQIWGDDGDDILRGGAGNDVLTGDDFSGGQGADTFVLAVGEGTDTIVDFESDRDFIGLADGLTLGSLTFEGESILFGEQTLAILLGVDTTALGADTFVPV